MALAFRFGEKESTRPIATSTDKYVEFNVFNTDGSTDVDDIVVNVENTQSVSTSFNWHHDYILTVSQDYTIDRVEVEEDLGSGYITNARGKYTDAEYPQYIQVDREANTVYFEPTNSYIVHELRDGNTTYYPDLTIIDIYVTPVQTEPVITVEEETIEEPIEYETDTVEDDTMPVGEEELIEGTEGIMSITYEITLEDGVEVSREVIGYEVVLEPVNAIQVIGTLEPTYDPVPISKQGNDDTYTVEPDTYQWAQPITIRANPGYTFDTISVDVWTVNDGWLLDVQDAEIPNDDDNVYEQTEFTYAPGRGYPNPGELQGFDTLVYTYADPNYEPEVTTETITVEEVIPHDEEVVYDDTILIGDTEYIEGSDGLANLTILITYEDGIEVSREVIDEEVLVEPVTAIEVRGDKPPKSVTWDMPVNGDSSGFWENYPYYGVTRLYENDTVDVLTYSTHAFESIELIMRTDGEPPRNGFGGSPGTPDTYETVSLPVYGQNGNVKFEWGDYFEDGDHLTIAISVITQEEIVESFPIRYYEELENASTDVEGIEVEPDQAITVTSDEGYILNSVTLIGDDETVNLTDVEGKSVIEIIPAEYFEPGLTTLEIQVTTAELIEVGYTEELENVVSSIESDTVSNFTVVNYEALEGFELHEVTVTLGDGSEVSYKLHEVPGEFNEEGTVLSLDFSTLVTDTVESIHVEAIAGYPRARFGSELVNASSNIPEGRGVNQEDTIVITADNGFVFNEGIELDIRTFDNNSPDLINLYPDEDPNFNEDKTVFTLNIGEYWEDRFTGTTLIIVTAVASEKTYDGFVSNFVNIYPVNQSILNTLSVDRFGDLVNGETVDYGDYFYNLYSLPVKLPEEMISNAVVPINIGQRTSNAEANYMLDNKVLFDLGTIRVEEEHHNVYDYMETETNIHVPYNEQPIYIDPDYVINQDIKLTLSLDLYNATATLNVYSSKIGNKLVSRTDIPLTHEIPFMRSSKDTLITEIGRYIHNELETPFIEVIRNIPYESNSDFGKQSNDYVTLHEVDGYVEVSDVFLDISASEDEKDIIEQLLASGVVIK